MQGRSVRPWRAGGRAGWLGMEGSCLARLATCLAPAGMARVVGLVLADLTGLLAKVAGAVGEATDLTQCHTLEGGESHLLHLQEVAGGSLGAQHYSYQLENRDGGEEGKAVIEVIDISDGLQAEGEGGDDDGWDEEVEEWQ